LFKGFIIAKSRVKSWVSVLPFRIKFLKLQPNYISAKLFLFKIYFLTQAFRNQPGLTTWLQHFVVSDTVKHPSNSVSKGLKHSSLPGILPFHSFWTKCIQLMHNSEVTSIYTSLSCLKLVNGFCWNFVLTE
jgi:hypothetical protein